MDYRISPCPLSGDPCGTYDFRCEQLANVKVKANCPMRCNQSMSETKCSKRGYGNAARVIGLEDLAADMYRKLSRRGQGAEFEARMKALGVAAWT